MKWFHLFITTVVSSSDCSCLWHALNPSYREHGTCGLCCERTLTVLVVVKRDNETRSYLRSRILFVVGDGAIAAVDDLTSINN